MTAQRPLLACLVLLSSLLIVMLTVIASGTGHAGNTGSAQNDPTLTLDPSSGPAGTFVSAYGSNYAGITCSLYAVPASLFTSQTCWISGGNLAGNFTVASDAPTGSYTVVAQTNAGSGDSATALFTVTVSTTTTATTTTPGTTTTVTTRLTTTSFTTSVTPVTTRTTGPCIIATATFGSEVSWAVQFLRSFRDRLVLSTRAGSAFMEVFNVWYYSFSPSVAGLIAGNDPLRAVARVILYPLFGAVGLSAFAYSVFSAAPEFAVVTAGLVASSLIGLVYLTLPALVGMRELLKKRIIRITSLAKTCLTLLAVALALLAAGELTGSFLLLAVGGSGVVLICLISAPAVVALAALRPKIE